MVISGRWAGAEIITFAGTCGKVFGSVVPVPEKAGAFTGDVHTELFPRNFFWIFDCRVGDGFAINRNGAFLGFYGNVKFCMNRVILEQVRHGGRIGQVVNGHHLHIGMVHGGAKYHPANSAKSVDS